MSEVIVNGTTYVPKESIKTQEQSSKTNRAVMVIDRGWIFAGDVKEDGGMLRIERAVWVFRWSEIGFSGVLADPKSPKVDIRQMPTTVEVPMASVVFRCPVADDWGL